MDKKEKNIGTTFVCDLGAGSTWAFTNNEHRGHLAFVEIEPNSQVETVSFQLGWFDI